MSKKGAVPLLDDDVLEEISTKAAAPYARDPKKKLDNKFIDLVRLFPPLPKKGTFDVNTIKKSVYFFS